MRAMLTKEKEISNSSHFRNQQWEWASGIGLEGLPPPSFPTSFPSMTYMVVLTQPAGVRSVPPNADEAWPGGVGQHGLCLKDTVPRHSVTEEDALCTCERACQPLHMG